MCNLPFRGHREGTQAEDEGDYDEDERKRGNFICIIELLSKYDPVLSELNSKPKGKTKYMSPMIQNELIQLLSKETEKELTCAIKAAPFYSIMLDTAQDISKIDQMCEIYRYCSIEYDDNGKPKALQINESFLGFHKVEGQSGAALSEQILQIIKQRGLSISRCRGQGYDGASNMKGIYKGVQKKIIDVEPSAVYVHCAAHNLNLVINDAVKNVTEMAQFYDIVQRVYVLFRLSIKT
ncbi:zinc finger MYM-type protein 1-like [Macrobrachium nipponense]|uniref:zinc finger MYM-type protein 1-like n=1 Tax=Macrobrachium nipponense TaxID=159736 RepID=UPI0030C88E47